MHFCKHKLQSLQISQSSVTSKQSVIAISQVPDMVWNLVSFFRYPSTDTYEYPSGTTSWSLTHEMISNLSITLFSPGPNDVTCCLLLSRVITEPNFNSILGTEIKSYAGAYPILSLNHLCSMLNRSNVLRNLVPFIQF